MGKGDIESIRRRKNKCDSKLKFVLGKAKNTVRKGENAGYQHFLRFTQCFRKASFSRSVNLSIMWLRVKFNRNGEEITRFVSSNGITTIKGTTHNKFVWLVRTSCKIVEFLFVHCPFR